MYTKCSDQIFGFPSSCFYIGEIWIAHIYQKRRKKRKSYPVNYFGTFILYFYNCSEVDFIKSVHNYI